MSTDVAQKDRIDSLIRFYRDYCRNEIGTLAQRFPQEQQALEVSFRDLFQFDHEYADDLLHKPTQILPQLERALGQYDLPAQPSEPLSEASVRIVDLPETEVYGVGEYRSDQIGELFAVEGQVGKVSDMKPRPVVAAFECQRCGTVTTVRQDNGQFQYPHECHSCERQGPFSILQGQSEWTDHQYARIQQPPEKTKGGNAQSVVVHLEDDLVGEFDAGDRVVVSGVMNVEKGDDSSPTFDVFIDGNAVEVEQTDYKEIDVDEYKEEIQAIAAGERGDPFDLLVGSIAPKHRGDEEIKLAIALQMFGGWARKYPDGSRDRGDSHILLLGDPGTGKSSFLRAVDNLAPRSTYASGKGASAAGMTAAAVPDDFGDTKWSLEAGALVLANGGIACVDEIDKMKEDAVSSMHDALESQTVHVNKAGINAHLNARTALLAAGNPEQGRFTTMEPIAQQIDLGPTLLSRFDLMFMVSDQPDPEKDRDVVEHMVKGRRIAGQTQRGDEVSEEERSVIEPSIEAEVLRAYIAYAKQNCFPTIQDEEVRERLEDYFVSLRGANGTDDEDIPVPVTFRSLEAIERLAEASARVRLSERVTKEDLERAIKLVGRSMRDVGIDPDSGKLDVDVIESGVSTSQRERRQLLQDIIDDLESEHRKGAPISRIFEVAEEEGITEKKARNQIRELKTQGHVYEVGGEYLRLT